MTVMVESFWGPMQVELFNRRRWKTRIELATAIHDYVELFHNTRRRHSALGARDAQPKRIRGSTQRNRGRLTPEARPTATRPKSWLERRRQLRGCRLRSADPDRCDTSFSSSTVPGACLNRSSLHLKAWNDTVLSPWRAADTRSDDAHPEEANPAAIHAPAAWGRRRACSRQGADSAGQGTGAQPAGTAWGLRQAAVEAGAGDRHRPLLGGLLVLAVAAVDRDPRRIDHDPARGRRDLRDRDLPRLPQRQPDRLAADRSTAAAAVRPRLPGGDRGDRLLQRGARRSRRRSTTSSSRTTQGSCACSSPTTAPPIAPSRWRAAARGRTLVSRSSASPTAARRRR